MKRFKKATDTLREVFLYYVIIMVVAAGLFSLTEHVDYSDALYWSGVTMTTVGYGDISPHSLFGKVLSVVLANISIFFLAPLIVVRMIEHLVDNRDLFSHEEQETMKKDISEIKSRIDEIYIKL